MYGLGFSHLLIHILEKKYGHESGMGRNGWPSKKPDSHVFCSLVLGNLAIVPAAASMGVFGCSSNPKIV